MRIVNAALLVLTLVLQPASAFAEGAEWVFPPGCTITWWEANTFNIYIGTTPTTQVLVGSVPENPATPPRMWTFACPTAPGQYYFSHTSVNAQGEGTHSATLPFVIKPAPPAALAPPTTLSVSPHN